MNTGAGFLTAIAAAFRRRSPLRHVIATKSESREQSRKYYAKHEQLARELGMQNPVAR